MRNIMRPKEEKGEVNMKKIVIIFFVFIAETLFAGSKKSLDTENRILTDEINQLKREVSSLELGTLNDLKKEYQTKIAQNKLFVDQSDYYKNNIYKKKEEIVKKKNSNKEFEDGQLPIFNERLESLKLNLFSAKELNQNLLMNLDDYKRKLAMTNSEIDKILKDNNIIEATE